MPGIITHKFRLNNAEQFLESFTEADNINTRYYMFLARAHGWTDDTSPPTPTDTILGSDFNIWRNMIAAKRVTSSSRLLHNDSDLCSFRKFWFRKILLIVHKLKFFFFCYGKRWRKFVR